MVLALSIMASAAFTVSAPANVNSDDGSFDVVLTTDVAEPFNAFVDFGTITPDTAADNATLVVSYNNSMAFGSIEGYVTNGSANQTFSVNVNYDFCSDKSARVDLDITEIDVKNSGRGDDTEWEFLDSVEIEVEVENTDNDDDVDDVIVEIKIFNSDGEDVTSDFDFDDEEADLGRIKEDDTEVAVFTIDKVKVEDLEKGDYRIYVRAYSEDTSECTADIDGDDYFEFEILNDLEDDFLVDETEEILASCGEDGVSVTFDVWNLGDEKEDNILVNLYSSTIGVDEYAIIEDLRSRKEESVNFVFDMPEYVSKETYSLSVYLYYDYDSDDGEDFEEKAYGDEVEDDFDIILKVLECKAPEPTVQVETTEDAKAGKEFTFEVKVENNAADAQNIIVTVDGADSWAEDVVVAPGVLALQGGAEGIATVTLKPTETGSQTFNVKTLIGVEEYSQPVTVEVESRFAVGQYFSTDYWEYWVAIALVVLILIVLISIIAVMRK